MTATYSASFRRQRQADVRFDLSLPRADVGDRCVCGALVVLARTVDGGDVVFDAEPGGVPAVRPGGEFVEVAAQRDLLGRRPLTVAEVGRGGQLRRHACTGATSRAR